MRASKTNDSKFSKTTLEFIKPYYKDKNRPRNMLSRRREMTFKEQQLFAKQFIKDLKKGLL